MAESQARNFGPPPGGLISAGAQSHAGATLVNSNGVTFGMDTAGNVTATVTPGAAAGIAAVQVSNTTYTSGTAVFSNANGISFGSSSPNGVTASYNSTQFAGQGTTFGGTNVSGSMTLNSAGLALSLSGPNESGIGLSAAGSSQTQGTVVFSNSNGVSFGMNGSTVTASVAAGGAAQSIGVSTGGNTAGNTGTYSGQVVLAGGNNVTLSVSSGAAGAQTITVSAANQTNQTVGVYGSSQTTGQSSSSTVDARSLSLVGAGNVSVGLSGGSVIISGAAGGQTNQTIGLYGSSQTTGQSSSSTVDARSLTLVGQGIVSVGLSGGSLLISATDAAQTSQTEAIYIAGNTTAQSSQSTYTVGSLNVSAAGLVSVGWSSNSLLISAPATAAATQFSGGISGGNTAGNTGTVSNELVLAGGNNITLSGSTNAGGMTATISAANQTNQSVGLYAVGNTTQNSSTTLDARTLSFDALGAATMGFSNGSIQVSVDANSVGVSTGGNTSGNTGTYSGQVVFAGGNNITLSVSSAAGGAQTITISGANAGGAQTGISSIAGGASTQTAGMVSFSNANGVSFGMSSGAVTGTMTASVAAQSNQTVGLYGSSQTTGQSSSSTVDARSITLVGQGIVSVGLSGGSFLVSATDAVQTNQTVGLYAVGNTTQNSSTTLDARTISFDGLGAATMGFSNGSVQVSVPVQTNQTIGVYHLNNTTGASSSSTIDARSMSFTFGGALSGGMTGGSIELSVPATSSIVGAGAITVSTNGSTISVSQGTGVTFGSSTNFAGTLSTNGLSIVQPYFTRSIYPNDNLTAISAPGNASMSFQYFPCGEPVTATRIDALVGWSGASSATTNTCAIALSAYAAIYTKNGATLSSLSSGSTQTTYSYASNTAGHTEFTQAAIRPISVPVNVNMMPGEYIIGFNFVTATSSIGASTTNLGQTFSMYGGNAIQTASNYAEIGSQTNASSNLVQGMGVYSAASTGMPAAVSISGIVGTGSSLSQANIGLVLRNN